jgi:hypothetical protein
MQLRIIVTVGLLVGALGCGDRSGLIPQGSDDAGTGGKGGTGQGGAGGLAQGGAGGLAQGGSGGSKTDAGPMCGALCDLYCPYGNVTDGQGCPLCQCKPPPVCPAIACPAIYCEFGHTTDVNGCSTCGCNRPPVCDAPACLLYCANGFKKDARGCSTCECNPSGTCAPSDCATPLPAQDPGTGAAARVAPPPCSDGSFPQTVCERDMTGTCRWNYGKCPADCSQVRDAGTCNGVAGCVWLQPGCSEPSIPTAGCYARAWLGCGDGGTFCPSGKQCQKRTVNPCTGSFASGSGGGTTGTGGSSGSGTGATATDRIAPPGMALPVPPACQVCAQAINICL